MVAKTMCAHQPIPGACAKPQQHRRCVQASNTPVVTPTSTFCRTPRRHRHTIRTSLNATQSSQQSQPQSVELLQYKLQDAIRMEDYKQAAQLRDELNSLRPQDTATALKKKMDQFVSQDKFEVSPVQCADLDVCEDYSHSTSHPDSALL